MNMRQLEVFYAVMSTGSISDAAKILHVSGPAVSRVLSHLEQRIGFALFDRIKGRLYPTAESQKLIDAVEGVYQGVRHIDELVQTLGEKKRGTFNVVASPSIGQAMIPLAIAALHQRLPELRIRFVCLGHEALKRHLLEGHSDIGISTLPMEHPHLTSQCIALSELVCICQWDHPLATREQVTVADLFDYPPIGYLAGTPMAHRVKELFADFDAVPASVIEVGTPTSACALVQSSAGIALVEEFSVQNWPKASFRVLRVDCARSIAANVLYQRGAPLSKTALAFIDCLEQILHERGLGTGETGFNLTPRLSLSMSIAH